MVVAVCAVRIELRSALKFPDKQRICREFSQFEGGVGASHQLKARRFAGFLTEFPTPRNREFFAQSRELFAEIRETLLSEGKRPFLARLFCGSRTPSVFASIFRA